MPLLGVLHTFCERSIFRFFILGHATSAGKCQLIRLYPCALSASTADNIALSTISFIGGLFYTHSPTLDAQPVLKALILPLLSTLR